MAGSSHGNHTTEGLQESFSPLARVVDTEGNVYGGFEEYMSSLPTRYSHVIPDARFRRFVSILRGETQPDKVQERRDRERLFNAKELGPKLEDGSHVPHGRWVLYNDFCVRTGQPKARPKRRNNYTGASALSYSLRGYGSAQI